MIDAITSSFQKRQNSEFAEKMSAYMRDKFEYFGLMADERKTIQKEFFPLLNMSFGEHERWEMVREFWEKPQREFIYFTIDWMNTFKPKTFQKEDIHHIHFLITNQSWWDSVDSLASNLLSKYNKQFPEMQQNWLEDWRESNNFWLRRSCLIFQLKYKNETDFDLLKSLIKENLHHKEFFIQKAIGWSLRQYAKFQPELVKEFVTSENIKGLAKREALKHLK